MSSGTLFFEACGGRYKLKAILQPVVLALWASLSSLPPNEAIVAVVSTDMVVNLDVNGNLKVVLLEVRATFLVLRYVYQV